ncbi:hypothetical protein OPU71_09485 [Niveibacterium sp. 24ML]|uniref:hypothetical protein n=1 Tax=Niveibacterium sp. 24ML TaxID=2985512 RepID=UPI00226E96FF|nr:hypothetical protein [Niveibacterium sp. 24ML]MCX9156352.1 hypothetical protein [Niveibacterium sp. 24ML]
MSAEQRAAAIAEWSERLSQAKQRLASYRKATEYPFNSRPASEQPDQMYPNEPVVEDRAMNNGSDETDPSVRIVSSQSRVFLASDEAVIFTIAARDADGKPLPLTINAARATGLPGEAGAAGISVAMAFNDQGRAGDAQAGDGTLSATLTPSPGPLASFDGTIRVELAFKADDKPGQHFFDVVRANTAPATWAGGFTDTLTDGSLVLSAPVEVRQAGRYVIHARVDDASGKPVALASFNEQLEAGAQTVRLTVFGKLIRDAAPRFPLTIRDVDGYLLHEHGHPDRALMPRLAGPVGVTAQYSLSSFSNAEWQGEQRSRYLAEFGKDLDQAKQALDALKQGG